MTTTTAEGRIDILEYARILYRKRWLLAGMTALACAAGVGMALLQKPIWISKATLLPSETRTENPGLAGLAALAGISMPQQSSQETYYGDIILSQDFLDTVIWIPWKVAQPEGAQRTLAEIYELKADSAAPNGRERFRQRMHEFIIEKKLVEFERDPGGLMVLSCSTVDPQVSYGLNEFLLTRLDSYNRLRKRTRTTEKKALIEERLGDVESALKQSEEHLRAFREKNLSVSTPALLLEQQRLLREVEVNSALYQELRKQYEITKIEIVDNTQILNVLEHPTVPAMPGKSARRKLVMLFTIMGFVFTAVGILAAQKISDFRKNLA